MSGSIKVHSELNLDVSVTVEDLTTPKRRTISKRGTDMMTRI